MTPETQFSPLSVLGQKYELAPRTVLGLGSGLYFEYFRAPHHSPSRFINGLHRDVEKELPNRISNYRADPTGTVRAALRANALWFNLDRAPTNGLLGMEMLAEELPQFNLLSDGSECVANMAMVIRETCALYRETYAAFLVDCVSHVPAAANLAQALNEIASEWYALANKLAQCADDDAQLESAGRLLRRLTLREEHFWGSILEM